jgi:hypothetical protein
MANLPRGVVQFSLMASGDYDARAFTCKGHRNGLADAAAAAGDDGGFSG